MFNCERTVSGSLKPYLPGSHLQAEKRKRLTLSHTPRLALLLPTAPPPQSPRPPSNSAPIPDRALHKYLHSSSGGSSRHNTEEPPSQHSPDPRRGQEWPTSSVEAGPPGPQGGVGTRSTPTQARAPCSGSGMIPIWSYGEKVLLGSDAANPAPCPAPSHHRARASPAQLQPDPGPDQNAQGGGGPPMASPAPQEEGCLSKLTPLGFSLVCSISRT